MEETSKIKFAVIGMGQVGKRHAELISRIPESELVAVCDIKAKSELGIDNLKVPFYSSLDELLGSEIECDVISICTPNGLHAEHSLRSLENKKHVIIEKPMALNVADCEKIISKALQVSRHVFCVMQNRYSPPSRWIKEVMDTHILGKIFLVQLNCYWNRDERYYAGNTWKGTPGLDGGTLFTQFSHFLDMMYWLFGDINHIQATFADFNHADTTSFEDSGMVLFNFLNGGMGSIHYSTAVWDQNFESSMTIIAEHGTVKISGQYMNEVTWCHIKNYTMPVLPKSNPANDYGTYKGSAANHRYVYENAIDTLKGRTTATTNALEGMKVVDIIQRIYSLKKLKKPEKINQ